MSYDVAHYLEGHNPAPVSKAELTADVARIKAIAHTVDAHGQDRDAILSQLPHVLGEAVEGDLIAVVDAFLAGARLPIVTSVL